MINNLVITSANISIPNWLKAFPKIVSYYSVADAQLQINTSTTIIWLHIGSDGSKWLMDSLRDIYAIERLARVVVLSNAPSQEEGAKVLSGGALGYCHAYSSAEVLVQVRSVVANGGFWIGREMLHYLIVSSQQLVTAQPEKVAGFLDKLSARERQVATQVSEGLSNKEIARNLNITERTVKAHISASFVALGVKDRLQLALMLNNRQIH